MAKRVVPEIFLVPVDRITTLVNHIWDASLPRAALCGALKEGNYEPAMLPRANVRMCTLCLRQLVLRFYTPIIDLDAEIDAKPQSPKLDDYLADVQEWDKEHYRP